MSSNALFDRYKYPYLYHFTCYGFLSLVYWHNWKLYPYIVSSFFLLTVRMNRILVELQNRVDAFLLWLWVPVSRGVVYTINATAATADEWETLLDWILLAGSIKFTSRRPLTVIWREFGSIWQIARFCHWWWLPVGRSVVVLQAYWIRTTLELEQCIWKERWP